MSRLTIFVALVVVALCFCTSEATPNVAGKGRHFAALQPLPVGHRQGDATLSAAARVRSSVGSRLGQTAGAPSVPACEVGINDATCGANFGSVTANGRMFCCGNKKDETPSISMFNSDVQATCSVGTVCEARPTTFAACRVGINDANCFFGQVRSAKYCCADAGGSLIFKQTLLDKTQLVLCSTPSKCAVKVMKATAADASKPQSTVVAPKATTSATPDGAATATVTFFDDAACTVGPESFSPPASGTCFAQNSNSGLRAKCESDGSFKVDSFDSKDCSRAAMASGSGKTEQQCVKLAPDVYVKAKCPVATAASVPAAVKDTSLKSSAPGVSPSNPLVPVVVAVLASVFTILTRA